MGRIPNVKMGGILHVCLLVIWTTSYAESHRCSVLGDPRGTPQEMNKNGGYWLNIFTTMIVTMEGWVTKFDYCAHSNGQTYVSFWEYNNRSAIPHSFLMREKVLFDAEKGCHMYTMPHNGSVYAKSGYMIGVHYPTNAGTFMYEVNSTSVAHSTGFTSATLLHDVRLGPFVDSHGWHNGIEKNPEIQGEKAVALRIFIDCYCHSGKCVGGCVAHCRDSACYHDSGFCAKGCEAGYSGDRCETECTDGRYGSSCTEVCGMCKNGEACNKNSGVCPQGKCRAGYKPPMCNECEDGWYGKNCINQCGECSYGICDKFNGGCQSPCKAGYQLPTCKECTDGRYGSSCNEVCGMCKNGDACNKNSGVCPQGKCTAGYKPPMCNECEDGRYGENCINQCGECSYGVCNKSNGECQSPCKAGYQLPTCKELCSVTRYGENCSKTCNCVDNERCHVVTGVCTNGCAKDWQGLACSVPLKEEQQGPVSTAVIAGVATLIIGTGIVVVIVVFTRRRRKKLNSRNVARRSTNVYMDDMATISLGNFPHTPESIQQAPLNSGGQSVVQTAMQHFLGRTKYVSCAKSVKGFGGTKIPEKLTNSTTSNGTSDTDSHSATAVYENFSSMKNLSNPIPVKNLADFVAKQKVGACKQLMHEFTLLPEGQTAPWTIAKNPDLIPKNNFKNILPYDQNRVKLELVNGDNLSHYINASFVDGYDRKRKFIACHGPRKATIDDFWRMIWQYDVTVIVMVTNMVEEGRVKCNKYWPEEKVNRYDAITVTPGVLEEWQDYVVRQFTVQKDNKKRLLWQFHYIGWPDHGVPAHASGLLALVQRVKAQTFKYPKAPVVVHCSAGVGRTGTFITLDWLLDQAAKESQVDVLGCVAQLRTFRINMVQSAAQYIFIYNTMNETILLGQTSIQCSEINTVYQNFQEPEKRQSKLEAQYRYLEDTKPSFSDEDFYFAMSKANRSKNRDNSILPAEKDRVWLTGETGSEDIYINAVTLQEYRKESSYYVTQLPLPDTAASFWCMIWQYEIPKIVVLETNNDCQWYPAKDKKMLFGQYGIRTVQEVEHYGFSACTIEMTQYNGCSDYSNIAATKEQNPPRVISLFILDTCDGKGLAPHIISLHRTLAKTTKAKCSSTAVLCRNGAYLSGQYVACCILFDMVNAEQEFDVFQVVQKIRHTRPQFIPSLEQYKQLYEIVKELASAEAEYSNFR